MGYAKIENLYRNTTILLFKECYVLEKIHGTSAHVGINETGELFFFSGEQQAAFEMLFDKEALQKTLAEMGGAITIYGECYGGKIQGMSNRYGPIVRFVAFDIKRGDRWLVVPEAAQVAKQCNLDFVWWARTTADAANLDGFRDMYSFQAQKTGMGNHTAEGIVIKPLQEMSDFRGNRIIAKHKRDDFRETFQPRRVGAPIEVLQEAESIAHEWVTPMRLQHVLQKCPASGIESTGDVIKAMLDDVLTEGAGEFVDSREVRKAIAAKAGKMYRESLTENT